MKKILAFVLSAVILLGIIPAGVFAEGKSDVPVPIAPIVLTVARDYIVLAPIVGYEYKMNDGEWQESNLFTGLEPLTEYVFYQRVAETDTENASESSEGTVAVTDKPVAEAPEAPTIREYNVQYVYLTYTPGYEYRMDDGSWRKEPYFAANFGEPHRYYQRVAESSQNYASEASEALVYELEPFERDEEIHVESILNRLHRFGRISCDFYDGNHYYPGDTFTGLQFSLDCVEWKNNVEFWGLEPSTEYTIYVRFRPTSGYKDTPPIVLEKFTTLAFSDCEGEIECSKLAAVSDTSVEIEALYSECFYIIVDSEGNPVSDWQYIEDWHDTTVFEGLDPDTEYTVYCRYWYIDPAGELIGYGKALPVRTLKEGEKYYRDLEGVKLTGDPQAVGTVLTADFSEVYIPEGATVTVQWYRDGEEMTGVTGTEYVTTNADFCAVFQVVITVEAEEESFYGRASSEELEMDAYLPGDVNGDFKINLSDASMTLKYIARWDISGFNKKAANMNGDTTVNLVDVARILKKIAGWKN